VVLSPRSVINTPVRRNSLHMNASPPTTPSDVSRSSSVIDAEILDFIISDYSQEVRRRRRAGLPSPCTSEDVDMPVRFALVSLILSSQTIKVLTRFQPNAGMLDTSVRVDKLGRIHLVRDEEFLVSEGFPMIYRHLLWMLVPYTESDPVWQKVAWDETVWVGDALSVTFMVEKVRKFN
jgi:hypothetical protein